MDRLLIAVVISATVASGCTDEHVGVWQAAVNGDRDDGSYPGVMGMFINKPEGIARCTGVLVAPNLVLTARHCVAPTSGSFVDCGSSPLGPAVAGSEILATTLGTMPTDDPSVYVAGSRVLVPAEGNDECGFDIAAVILERSLDPAEAVPFAPRLDVPASAGEAVTAVGFGSGGSGSFGVRRVLDGLEVICIGADGCGGDVVQPTELLTDDGGFCQYDSGAPALDAEGQVLGVVSRGINPCGSPILSATYPWAAWLRGLGREAALSGGYEAPRWAEDGAVLPDGSADGATGDSAAGDGGPDAAPPVPTGGDGSCSTTVHTEGRFPGLSWVLLLVAGSLWIRRRRTAHQGSRR